MEFAVIQTGGKQYKVSPGDVITIEKLDGDFKQGDAITFDSVLLVDDGTKTTVGAPLVKDAKVKGTFESAGRAKKINVIKYKQKSRYFVKNGHRQHFIKVRIESVK
jgi:large subunit ribosomal protein L21